MKITKLEKAIIQNIAENEYSPVNGQRPSRVEDCICWSDTIDAGPNQLAGKTISGVMGSLVKKGLVETNGEDICLTEKGFQAYQQN